MGTGRPRRSIEVVIPWLDVGCIHRRRALEWLLERLEWPVRVAELEAPPWRKGAAIIQGLRSSRAEIVVVSDADVWSEGTAEAISRVSNGAPWAMPHGSLLRLSEAGTTELLAGGRWREHRLAEPAYTGIFGGGILAAPRDTLLTAPPDPRFEGWGHEDQAWDIALHALAGKPWRGEAELLHLWHPPAPRRNRKHGSQANWNLRRRYLKARRSPEQILSIIGEAV